jgi:uncharacterized protein
MPVNLETLRRLAVAQTLFARTTLKGALDRFGFVQADPIRAPARAQDLILRHRVNKYKVGDLERKYAGLEVEEDFFINYGFVTKAVQRLMHPRSDSGVPAAGGLPCPAARRKRALELLGFVRERGTVHPREVDSYFSHGKVKNYWGGSSNATTHLLDAMHYQGLLRVVRRENGIRLYAAHDHEPGPQDETERQSRLDSLTDIAIRIYAPLPAKSLAFLLRRLRFAVPQWQTEITATLKRAKERLVHARVDGVDWYWPEPAPKNETQEDIVRLLTPFDPLVWDRWRFELLWGWTYRFEAYTPPAKRKLGYYAMPMLWRDRIIGWGNLSVRYGNLDAQFGYIGAPPRQRTFKRGLDEELDRIRLFLKLKN